MLHATRFVTFLKIWNFCMPFKGFHYMFRPIWPLSGVKIVALETLQCSFTLTCSYSCIPMYTGRCSFVVCRCDSPPTLQFALPTPATEWEWSWVPLALNTLICKVAEINGFMFIWHFLWNPREIRRVCVKHHRDYSFDEYPCNSLSTS
jgi:hypothetical protein